MMTEGESESEWVSEWESEWEWVNEGASESEWLNLLTELRVLKVNSSLRFRVIKAIRV
jgi:hypothetical protein